MARFRPELNKQVQSLDLTLFPVGTYITYLAVFEHRAYAYFSFW